MWKQSHNTIDQWSAGKHVSVKIVHTIGGKISGTAPIGIKKRKVENPYEMIGGDAMLTQVAMNNTNSTRKLAIARMLLVQLFSK